MFHGWQHGKLTTMPSLWNKSSGHPSQTAPPTSLGWWDSEVSLNLVLYNMVRLCWVDQLWNHCLIWAIGGETLIICESTWINIDQSRECHPTLAIQTTKCFVFNLVWIQLNPNVFAYFRFICWYIWYCQSADDAIHRSQLAKGSWTARGWQACRASAATDARGVPCTGLGQMTWHDWGRGLAHKDRKGTTTKTGGMQLQVTLYNYQVYK